MPRRDPGSLSDQAYLDIVAHLFESNLFPAGEEELTLSVIESIQIEERDGPRPVPNGALVQVVGCLTRAADGWTLTSAGDPVRTDTSNSSTPKELDHAVVRELGNQTFRLQNVDYLGLNSISTPTRARRCRRRVMSSDSPTRSASTLLRWRWSRPVAGDEDPRNRAGLRRFRRKAAIPPAFLRCLPRRSSGPR